MGSWRRRHPILAAVVVALAAYVLSALALLVLGDATPAQAWGVPTAVGAATVGFVAWAVFSRDPEDPGLPLGGDGGS